MKTLFAGLSRIVNDNLLTRFAKRFLIIHEGDEARLKMDLALSRKSNNNPPNPLAKHRVRFFAGPFGHGVRGPIFQLAPPTKQDSRQSLRYKLFVLAFKESSLRFDAPRRARRRIAREWTRSNYKLFTAANAA